MNTIVLNDGTRIENGEVGETSDSLFVWFTGTLKKAFATFTDTGKTARITFIYGEMQDVYEGYTDCRGINVEDNGQVSVCLKGGRKVV